MCKDDDSAMSQHTWERPLAQYTMPLTKELAIPQAYTCTEEVPAQQHVKTDCRDSTCWTSVQRVSYIFIYIFLKLLFLS